VHIRGTVRESPGKQRLEVHADDVRLIGDAPQVSPAAAARSTLCDGQYANVLQCAVVTIALRTSCCSVRHAFVLKFYSAVTAKHQSFACGDAIEHGAFPSRILSEGASHNIILMSTYQAGSDIKSIQIINLVKISDK
jgi:hypothetical protein